MAKHGFVQAATVDGGLIGKERLIRDHLTTKVSGKWETKKSAGPALFFVSWKALAQRVQSRQTPFNTDSFALREYKERVTRFQLINPHRRGISDFLGLLLSLHQTK